MSWLRVLATIALLSGVAMADPWLVPLAPESHVIGGFRARGKTKVTDRTIRYLSHVAVGDLIARRRPAAARASAAVERAVRDGLGDARGLPGDGVVVVAHRRATSTRGSSRRPSSCCRATARSASATPRTTSAAATRSSCSTARSARSTSLFFGSFLDPAVHGTQADLPHSTSTSSAASSTSTLNPPSDPTLVRRSRARRRRPSSTPAR